MLYGALYDVIGYQRFGGLYCLHSHDEMNSPQVEVQVTSQPYSAIFYHDVSCYLKRFPVPVIQQAS